MQQKGTLFVADPIEVYLTRAAACIKSCRPFASMGLVPMGALKAGREVRFKRKGLNNRASFI